MATPGRQRPVRPATTSSTTEQAALRAKIATMTYSFAQQMPQLPSRPSSASPVPPSRPTSLAADHNSPLAEDPNFPLLAPVQQRQPSLNSNRSATSTYSSSPQRAWETSSSKQTSGTNRGPRWPNAQGKTATAAEVVASNPLDQASQDEEYSESAKQEAELALYSKLVPTTSAVPRNPGRPLGGGGLRATGSVVAQPNRGTSSPLHSAQTHGIPRKEPMASRMRSISSETSAPQLARRVARPNRTASATPPPQAPMSDKPSEASSEGKGGDSKDDQLAKESLKQEVTAETSPRLKNIFAVYGKVEKEPPNIISQKDSQQELAPLEDHSKNERPEPPRVRAQTPTSRRLEEAFNGADRFENTRTPSPIPMRRHQIGALRRSPALSPPPVPSLSRNSSGRDLLSSPAKNGTKSPTGDVATEIPPGFEGRTAGLTRAGFMTRGKSDGSTSSKPSEREKAPVPPQNARADAFREAINSRRNSSSSRPGSRRNSHSDSPNTSTRGSRGNPSAIRAGFEHEQSPRQDGKRGAPRANSQQTKAPSPSNTQPNKTIPKAVGDGSTALSSKHRKDAGRFVRRTVKPNGGLIGESNSIANLRGSRTTPTRSNGMSSFTNPVSYYTNVSPPHSNDISIVSAPASTVRERQQSKTHTRVNPEDIDVIPGRDVSGSTEVLGSNLQTQAGRMNGWSETEKNGECEATADLINHLLNGNGEERPTEVRAPIVSRASRGETNGSSMIDRVRQWQLNSESVTSLLTAPEKPEEVLPPLPDPDEDARFESMLRSMGWTPPEEDETPRNHRISNVGLAFRQGRTGKIPVDIGPRRSGNGRDTQGLYYSHFQ